MKLPKIGGNKKSEKKEEVKEKEEKKEKKVKKEEKAEGSRWSSVFLLLFVMIVSGCVWAYGAFTDTFGKGMTESGAENSERNYESVNVEVETKKLEQTEVETKTNKTDNLKLQNDSSSMSNFEENPGF